MSLLRASVAALLALLPLAARAQLSVYLTFSPTHLSSVDTGSTFSSTGYTEQTTSFWSPAIGGGVTLPILHLPVVALNLDLRGSTHPGTPGSDTGLAGIQLAIHPHVIPFKPYVEFAGGYLAARTTNISTGPNGLTTGGTFTNKYAAYEVLGGVDYPLIHFLDLRIIEIGAGQGALLSSHNANLLTLNTGLVLHF